MSELPVATAVTTPDALFIVATLSSALDHVPPESPSVSKSVVPSEQTVSVPLSVPASGAAVAVPEADTVWSTAEVAEQVTLPLGDPDAVEANRTYIGVEETFPELADTLTEPLKFVSSVETSNPAGAVTVMPVELLT